MADAKLQCVISDNARGLLRSFIVREKNEAASPPDETASQIGVLTMMSRQPIFKTLERDHQILEVNCVRARADQIWPIEILGLLQVGHCSRRTGLMPFFFPFGGLAKTARCMTITKSSGLHNSA